MKRQLLIVCALLLLATAPAFAAGLMQPKDSTLPALQIEDHDVKVVINNGFAVTTVDQVFHNPNDVDLDAVYTFPLPKDASLSELSLWIDGQEVVGEVVEKEEARRIVKEEKGAGRETALAEQREYYAFDVFVSPVRAASRTRVRLVYLQPIEIDAGVGRYVYPLEEGKIDEEMHVFWDRLPQIHGRFTFEATVRSSYPLADVRLKGYKGAAVNQDTDDTWSVFVEETEGGASLDRDLVLYYRLSEDAPARVDLLPYRSGDGPGTFMLVVTPGADLQPITEGVDWTIVLDVSGSMGDKIGTAADAVSRSFDEMRPNDRVRVVTFANDVQRLTDWQSLDAESVKTVRDKLAAISVGGGTNMYAGLKAGLDGLDADRTSAVILVSDGGANVGPIAHREFLQLIGRKDVRLFTVVLGQGANQPLMRRLAEDSNGFSMSLSNQDDLYGRILQARDKLSHEALHGVRVELDGVKTFDQAPERIPSAYYGQQIVLFGRYSRPGEATLKLRARISGEDRSWTTRVSLPKQDETYPELERLWALARVRELQKRIDDFGGESEVREAIVGIGTGYSIVTDYTSMVVVREERFEELGIERKNRERTERERGARETRAARPIVSTRADAKQPMFGERRAPTTGGGGAGAVGPAWIVGLGLLYGARRLTRRGKRRP
jgi:Ca-activated chloride channel family protein